MPKKIHDLTKVFASAFFIDLKKRNVAKPFKHYISKQTNFETDINMAFKDVGNAMRASYVSK